MAITGTFVLPADVILVPVTELPAHVREQMKCEEGDYAVTHPRARTPSKVVDAQGVELLKEFRTPKKIIEAVIGYSRARKCDPEGALEDAFPMLVRLMQAR